MAAANPLTLDTSAQATPGLMTAPLATAMPTPAAASTYTGAQANAANFGVTEDQTVQGQVKKIIAENSPLQQMAETRSNQDMNNRGLMNSSMAVQSGQAALYGAALPIATSDAATYARAGEFNAGAQQQVGLANQGSTNQANLTNSAATNDMTKLGMDAQTKTALAQIEASYKTLMQSSQGASEMYKQYMLNATNIMSNKDMTMEAKNTAIKNQISGLNNGLELMGKINNLNMGNLLTFDTAGLPAPAAPAAPAAPTQPPTVDDWWSTQPYAGI